MKAGLWGRVHTPRHGSSPDLFRHGDSRRRVLHVGPAATEVGGIQSVIRAYAEIDVPAVEIIPVASSTWNGIVPSVRLATLAACRLAFERLSPDFSAGRSSVHAHLSQGGSFIREGALVVLARMLGYQTFVTIHGSSFVPFCRRSVLTRWLVRGVTGCAHAVSVLNAESANALAMLGRQAIRLPNPGPVSADAAREASDAGTRDRVVVFAGAVGPRKGADVLAEAWPAVRAEISDAVLKVFGPVEDERVRAALADAYQGRISSKQVRAELSRARVAVLPSRAEAMPVFVIEALASGTPCVVSPVAAMPEMVQGAGVVLPSVDSPDELADALIRLLQDDALASRMGAGATENYLTCFSPTVVAEQLMSFYAR